jgi:cell division septation protein DedD
MMTKPDDQYHVSATEIGTVRVFTTELDPEGAAAITASNVHKLLGAGVELDAAKVEAFPAKVIQSMGLSAYLQDGYGIAEADLNGKRAALDALTDLIILIPSSAFQAQAQTLDPNPALRFIGMFHEPAKAPPIQMAKTEAAEGTIAPPVSPANADDLRQKKGSWIIALGALIIAATLVLFAVF